MPTVTNPFVHDKSYYKRDFRNVEHYVNNVALYLSIIHGDDFEECKQWVQDAINPNGCFARQIPRLMTLTRPSEGNRIIEEITPDEFFEDIVKNHRLVSPSLAVFHNPHYKRSVLADFIAKNVKLRSKAKKEMFLAEQQGDEVLKKIKNDEQSTRKISNNSMSGAHNSLFTILWMRSAHSALTSTCRTATAYANANNEKFLSGNRHYYNPEITMEALVSTLALADLPAIAAVMERYQLHYPTPEEVLRVIRYSSDFYWPHAHAEHAKFLAFAQKLTPIQRAALVYCQDAWHLMQFNEGFFRTFLGKLIAYATVPHPDPVPVWKAMDDGIKAFVFSLHGPEMQGKVVKDLAAEDPELFARVAQTAVNTWATLAEYSDLIECLWATPILPASVANFTNSIRRSSLLSDTDSTIFTVQDWCRWYSGRDIVNRETSAIRNTMIFFAGQQIIHILAIVSANMGVVPDQLNQLAMKNEFSFPVLVLTTRAKHYFASINEQEGTVYEKRKIETKGVEMKNSKTSEELRKAAVEMQEWILDTLAAGEKLEILPRLKWIGDLERGIISSVNRGEIKYLTTTQLKNPEAYSNGEDSNAYRYHQRWDSLFGVKYGPAPPLPYDAIKVSTLLNNPTKIKAWIESMEDPQLQATFRAYVERTKVHDLSTWVLPREICQQRGVPQELVRVIDVRKLVYTAMSTFYLELETLGFFFVNGDLTRLVSDTY